MEPARATQIEYTLLATIAGLCLAVEQDRIDLSVAEQILFSPGCMGVLEALGFDQAMVNLIHEGTELEDVESLVPEKYAAALNTLKNRALNRLEALPPYNYKLDKWLVTCVAREGDR